MEKEAQLARHRFAERYEYPSLWETQEMITELENRYLRYLDAETLPPTEQDFDLGKPRCTVSMYSSLLAQQRIANLEGLARARHTNRSAEEMKMLVCMRSMSRCTRLEKLMVVVWMATMMKI